MPLPSFTTVSYGELRGFWSRYKNDPDVRRLLLEVQRSRRVPEEIQYFLDVVIQKFWREEGHGQLVAMEKLRVLLAELRGSSGAATDPSAFYH